MSVYFIILIGLCFIIISRAIFGRKFNPLSLYTIIWGVMLVLFELRLMPFYPLSTLTWTVIIIAYLSFFFGILTIYMWEKKFRIENDQDNNSSSPLLLFEDGGKQIRNIIIIFSILGLYGALQHWAILLKEFGNVAGVLLHAAKVYHMRNANEISGVVPYVWMFSFPAAFFAGIYMAYKGRITFISILPLLGIIIKDLAKVARSGILIGMFEFFIAYIFFNYFLKNSTTRKVSRWNIIFSFIVILALMISAASIVKLFRNPVENYAATNRTLAQFEGNAFISPHIYFYAASQIGVLNRFLEEDSEDMPIGSSTFTSVYNVLSSLGLTEKLELKQKGYLIPQWSNTATYLRDFYNDYGIAGILLGPYLLGLLTTFFWFKFFRNGNLKYLLILTQLNVIIALSFFVLATRSPVIIFIIFLCYPILNFMENYQNRKKNFSSKTIVN